VSPDHVIVTGGAGFIGSHLCEGLLAKGYAVTAIDNLASGCMKNLEPVADHPLFHFLERDICAELSPSDLPLGARYGVHGILHFACPASPVDFIRLDREILDVLSIGTRRMIELATAHDARLVLASTSEIYGEAASFPQKETDGGMVDLEGPSSCYVEGKRFSEASVFSAVRRGRLNGGVIRIFNTYGPRMRTDDGRLIPTLCTNALRGRPVMIEGDGRQTRSLCFVSDLVEGALRYLESPLTAPVNLGGQTEHSLIEIVEVLEKVAGRPIATEHVPPRSKDPLRRCPDLSRSRDFLGWSARVGLAEGLGLTLDFYDKSGFGHQEVPPAFALRVGKEDLGRLDRRGPVKTGRRTLDV
jgi:dTDP-glucose 4,6-dehydratase